MSLNSIDQVMLLFITDLIAVLVIFIALLNITNIISYYKVVNGNTRLDRSTYIYYLIDKKAYVMDPSQQSSLGLVGPLLFEEYQSIVKKLKDAKTEDW